MAPRRRSLPADLATVADLERSIALAEAHMTEFGTLAASLVALGYPAQAAFARSLLGLAQEHFLSLHARCDRLLREAPPPG
jgi:hypothetical protein